MPQNSIEIYVTINREVYFGAENDGSLMLLKSEFSDNEADNSIKINGNQKIIGITIFKGNSCIYKSSKNIKIHKIDLPKDIINLWGKFLNDIKIYISLENRIVECFFPNEYLEKKDGDCSDKSLNFSNHIDSTAIDYDTNQRSFRIKICGWVFDDGDEEPIRIELHANGKKISSTINFINRADVANAYPNISKHCGFILSGYTSNINSLCIKFYKRDSFITKNIEVNSKLTSLNKSLKEIVIKEASYKSRIDFKVKNQLKKLKLSIVVLTRLSHNLCLPLLERIKTDCPNDELIVVCHNLADCDEKMIHIIADKTISIDGEFNWSIFNNLAFEAASNEYLLFLNDDVYPAANDWRHTLIANLDRKSIIGSQLISQELSVQHAGIGIFGNTALTLDVHDKNINAVTGAFMSMHKEVFNCVGKFNEKLPITFNDVEFCMKAATKGIKISIPEELIFYHFESSTRHSIEDDSAITNSYISEIAIGNAEPRLVDDQKTAMLKSEPIEYIQHTNYIPKKIVVIKIDHIGDFCSCIEAFKALRLMYMDAEISLICSPEVSAFAMTLGIFSDVIAFRSFNKISELGRIHETIRNSNKFDLALDFRKHGDAREVIIDIDAEFKFAMVQSRSDDEIIMQNNSIKCFNCHNESTSLAVNHSVWQESLTFIEYIHGHLSSQVTKIDSLRLTPIRLGRKNIAIFPFSGSSTREWPIDLYIRLAVDLRNKFSKNIITLYADESNAWRLENHSLTLSKFSIMTKAPRNLLELIDNLSEESTLVISNNSGPSWLASHLNIPFVGIFSGSVDASHWLPKGGIGVRRNVSCSPCYLSSSKDCHRQLLCLNSIAPRHVSLLIEE